MTARLDISHREDKTGLEVQMAQLTGANGTSALVNDIVAALTGGGGTTWATIPLFPVATVAATGSTVTDAAQLGIVFTVVTAADATKGVKLPATPAVGTMVIVKNNAAAVLKVWPDAAATINAIGANGALSVAANAPAIFIAQSATQWWSIPLLPS